MKLKNLLKENEDHCGFTPHLLPPRPAFYPPKMTADAAAIILPPKMTADTATTFFPPKKRLPSEEEVFPFYIPL
jgi:hypothetical protein